MKKQLKAKSRYYKPFITTHLWLSPFCLVPTVMIMASCNRNPILLAAATSFRSSNNFVRRTLSSHPSTRNSAILAMVTPRQLPTVATFAGKVHNTNVNYLMTNGALSINRNKQYLEPLQRRAFHIEDGQESNLLMMTHDDNDNDAIQDGKEASLLRKWNIPELKKEGARLISRCYKKIGKAAARLEKGNQIAEELRTDPDATQDDLEACPNIGALKVDLQSLKDRLKNLNMLMDKLQESEIGKKKDLVLPEDIVELILELDVKDEPPKRDQNVKKKKKKGPRQVAPRKPYFQYYTENNTEIRVGRRSSDNDELSCNPQHRDGPDWWMHASGCSGSHVVIRCHDETLNQEVINDGASLAARQSKCIGNIIKVSLTRCRDVKKPPGAAAGLVQLTGKVRTVSVDMKKAEKRLSRLDETCEKVEEH